MKAEAFGTVTGRVISIAREKVGKKATDKATAIIDVTGESQYTNVVPVSAMGKSFDKLDGIKEGDEVTCSVYLRGREWNGKYFAENAVKDCRVISAAASATAAEMKEPEADGQEMPF